MPIVPALVYADTAIPESVESEIAQPEIIDETPDVVVENTLIEDEVIDVVSETLSETIDEPVPNDDLTDLEVTESVEPQTEFDADLILENDPAEIVDLPVEDELVLSIDDTVVADPDITSETELASTTPDTIDDSVSDEVFTSTTEEAIVEEEIVVTDEETEVVATSTDVIQPEVHTVITPENKFTFSEKECVTVGDGSFYCARADSAAEVMSADRVFAAPDSDGDREVYVEKAGELIQITHNLTDDDAPYYDAISNAIVWQRLINERYQIVLYDIEKSEETVLTADRYNNMQPSMHGDAIVWQGWVGNDWEIMVYQGGEITMLTDNTTHDIDPDISGDYIIWQAFEGESWHVKVYDRVSKSIETIDDAGPVSLENPRLVLVYDAKHDNGDVETRGYDLKSKSSVPLSSTPTPTPESIPDPEQTGEDRAMVSSGVQLKTKTDDDSDANPFDTNNDNASSTPTDIVTTTSDIVIPGFGEDIEPLPIYELPDANTLPAETGDIVVTSFDDKKLQPFEDLVIEPFVAESSSTDSQ